MVLLFDLDNTLVDRRAALDRWADSWRWANGLDADAAAWLTEADDDGYRPRAELFAEAIARFDLDTDLENLLAEYRRQLHTYFEPDPTVNSRLRELRDKGWRIGVVTNGSSTQHATIASAHLADLIESVTVSGELGVRKPHPRIFQAAADAIGGGLEHGWMVGDNPEADIQGGAAVGLYTIWISHGSEWPLPDLQPTVIAETVHDALDFLLRCPVE